MIFLAVTALLIGAEGDAPPKAAWEVRCRVDELSDVRSCSLRNGNLEPQFALLLVGAKGSPIVMPGVHDFPGRKATVRVDQNKAIVFAPADKRDSGKQIELVEQLRQGKVARFEYHQWPEGAQRASIDLAGFREAYAELIRERDQAGPTDWRAAESSPPEETPKAPEDPPRPPVQEASVFEVGPPAVSNGDVDREALARYVKARKAAIGACYDKEHRRKPGLAGRVRVRLLVSSSGRATEINIEENTLADDAVVACIKSIIRTWVFPFKPDSDVAVTLPFAWSIEGDENRAPEGDAAKQEGERYYGIIASAVRRLYGVPASIPEAERGRLRADIAIRLNAEGSLLGVKLIRSSGNVAFDDAVLVATKKAAPFGPPPPSLVGVLRDGGVQLRFTP